MTYREINPLGTVVVVFPNELKVIQKSMEYSTINKFKYVSSNTKMNVELENGSV